MKPSRIFGVALLLVLSVWAGPSFRAEEPQVQKAIYNALSDDDEMTIGRNAAEQTEQKLPMLSDFALDTYLDHLGQQLAKQSRRPTLQYHFKVVNSPVVNAFSLPGGYVYVNRGLLDFAQSESELSGVLCHEIGHIVAYHSMNDVARRMLLDKLIQQGKQAGLLSDAQVQDALQRYGGPMLLFVNAKFSRDQENEADMLGLYNTIRGGYDPEGMVALLGRLKQFTGNPDLVHTLLMNHPLPQERVDALELELKQNPPPSGLTKDSYLFAGAKYRLKMLPPAPPPAKD